MTSTLTCSIIYLLICSMGSIRLTCGITSMLTCTIISMRTCTIASIRLHIRLALRRPGLRPGARALSASSTLELRGRGISPASPRHLP